MQCLHQCICATPVELRKAWEKAWPEHVGNPNGALHSFDGAYDGADKHAFGYDLQCWKVKTGYFTDKYVMFIRVRFKSGSMPLGWAPAKTMSLAIGRANMVMSGDFAPYRTLREALADNTV